MGREAESPRLPEVTLVISLTRLPPKGTSCRIDPRPGTAADYLAGGGVVAVTVKTWPVEPPSSIRLPAGTKTLPLSRTLS